MLLSLLMVGLLNEYTLQLRAALGIGDPVECQNYYGYVSGGYIALFALMEKWIEEDHRWSNAMERKLDASFSTPPSPLFTICSFGLIEVLEHPRFSNTLDLDQKNKRNTCGLYLAARCGHNEVVRKLLDLGADINATGYQYGTALHAASFGGHQGIVNLLLDLGARSSTDEGEFSSPLQAALANGHDAVSNALLDAGFQPATQRQFDDILKIASFKGNIDIIQRLLNDRGINFSPNICPNPLQIALVSGKTRKVRQLLKTCNNINEETGFFGNALAAAIASRKVSLVKLVVDAGARLDLRGRFGFPLCAAIAPTSSIL